MRALLFDCETTGLNFEKDRIIEVGGMFTDEKFSEIPDAGFSYFMWESGYPALTEEITKLTGIELETLHREAHIPRGVFRALDEAVQGYEPDFIVAYNRVFDETMFRSEVARGGFETLKGISLMLSVPWVCAMKDLESNLDFKCWKLSHLSLDRGLAVDPGDLHRALDDVKLMRRMLVQAGADVRDLYAYQMQPTIYIRALVPPPWEDKGAVKKIDIAKKAGFNYQQAKGDQDGPIFEKCWVKKIKAKNLEMEEKNCLLPIRVIEEA